ncbi:hypothetical protein D0Y65_004144, partial [Glycine soja]
ALVDHHKGDIPIIRPEVEWTNKDLAIMELNTKAHYTLTYVLSKNEFSKICILKTTNEIWDSLSINYEGIKDVQLRKAATLHMVESDASYDNSDESIDNEMALTSRKSKQMMKKKRKFRHFSRRKDARFKKKHKEKNNEIICFECKKHVHIKAKCPQIKRKGHSGDKKKKSLMVTWDDSDNEKSNILDDEQANIYLMANTNEKVEVKTCFESNSSSSSSSLDNGEDMPYDLLQNSHMISLKWKKYKEKYKISACENTELKKSNEVLQEKIQALEKSLSQTSKIDESYTVRKPREKITCLTKDFGKFLESSNTLTHASKISSTSSKSLFVAEKCDFYGKSAHCKFRCIHKKKQMSKGTNAYGPKKIWVPKSQIVPIIDILGRKRLGFKLVPRQWMLTTRDGGKVYVPQPKTH